MPRSIDLDLMHVMFLQTFINKEVVFQYFLTAKYKKRKQKSNDLKKDWEEKNTRLLYLIFFEHTTV